jgi:hypothetical protein
MEKKFTPTGVTAQLNEQLPVPATSKLLHLQTSLSQRLASSLWRFPGREIAKSTWSELRDHSRNSTGLKNSTGHGTNTDSSGPLSIIGTMPFSHVS